MTTFTHLKKSHEHKVFNICLQIFTKWFLLNLFLVLFCSSRKWAFKPRSRISPHIEAEDIQEEQSNNWYPFPPKWPLKMVTGLATSTAHPRRNQIRVHPPPRSLYLINLSAPASWTARNKHAYKETARCAKESDYIGWTWNPLILTTFSIGFRMCGGRVLDEMRPR